MSPQEAYQSREAEFGASAERLRKLAERLSMARLAAFAGGLLLFAVLLSLSVMAALVTLSAALILFAWLVIKHENTEKSRKRYLRLAEINRLELKCLEGDFSGFKPGEEYAERDHPYSYDLDIFGKASLFQFICCTTKENGLTVNEKLKQPRVSIRFLSRCQSCCETAAADTSVVSRASLLHQGALK